MTTKEAFIAELDEIEVADATIEKTMLDRALTGTDAYAATDDQKKAIDLCQIDVLYRLYTRSDIREGDFQKSHPDFLRKVTTRLQYLAKKHNVTEVLEALDDTPTLSDVSHLW